MNIFMYLIFIVTGIFLTDLVYIDLAHSGDSYNHFSKMKVILDTLIKFQTSEYDIAPLPQVINYINSAGYIEELQKFVEDDQYKYVTLWNHLLHLIGSTLIFLRWKDSYSKLLFFSLSLKLEPKSLVGSRAGSKESMKEVSSSTSTSTTINSSPNHRVGSFNNRGPFSQFKFIPMHRKSRSLGSKWVYYYIVHTIEYFIFFYIKNKV